MTKAEEYKLILDQTNILMERRQNVTTVYLTVNAAIGGAISFLFNSGPVATLPQKLSLLLLLGAGVVSCFIWRQLIHSYRKILKWWFGKLRETENMLNQQNEIGCVINEEYKYFYNSQTAVEKVSIAQYEQILAIILLVIYGLFSAGIILSILFPTLFT